MNLVIHDLGTEEWNRIRMHYDGWNVISDQGMIHPCIGCFSCWNKTPGQCIIKDGYENMGRLIHQAEEVVVISKYTFGGFSGFVKNVFDRSLGFVLPQFTVINGETHHKKRYDEDKPFTFLFYGHALTEKEKESARKYVRAVCTNIRGHVRDVIFLEKADHTDFELRTSHRPSGRIVLLNGSMRCANGNSARFAGQLSGLLRKKSEMIHLKDHLNDISALIRILEKTEILVLCMPLYVDGLPSQVIRLMEQFMHEYKGGPLKIYVLANMGLYESRQLENLFSAVRQWCRKMGFSYCGGLGISAGELLGTLVQYLPFRAGATKKAAKGMADLAAAINSGGKTKNIYTQPFLFPRALYLFIANVSWNRAARKNGIRPKDLYRRL